MELSSWIVVGFVVMLLVVIDIIDDFINDDDGGGGFLPIPPRVHDDPSED